MSPMTYKLRLYGPSCPRMTHTMKLISKYKKADSSVGGWPAFRKSRSDIGCASLTDSKIGSQDAAGQPDGWEKRRTGRALKVYLACDAELTRNIGSFPLASEMEYAI